ncbi:hypothetical protein B1748_06490 [Paenibacillus sp. MY03]|jgi:hypothetical protein|uniref:DUF2627 domain-containing protein n=1 Tax=Paenibacillus agaridevorans TaxID=171404 RepID=A0A2R5EZL3_9BACL|nr:MULTISPECIES: DUF2627 domain-containing protein [Paenibacillus]OUS77445.1 hypothetical protein B1748_06490 [Paenibacillus sp. MY03]GBG12110.1 hypothetical protein PAT3040_06971 [Paenibacillus agaridevorans]
MKLVVARIIAILFLVVPGIVACFGFLHMKDATFDYFSQYGNDQVTPDFAWLKFLLGFVMFFLGAGFIGGWIFFRDRKRNYVAPRFKKKRPRPPRPQSGAPGGQ